MWQLHDLRYPAFPVVGKIITGDPPSCPFHKSLCEENQIGKKPKEDIQNANVKQTRQGEMVAYSRNTARG